MVGGSTVNLQVKGGESYIRISGGGELKMESGAVYLCPSLLPLEGSGVYLPGTLYDTTKTAAYNAKFTETVEYKGAVWKHNPDHEDDGQLSGEVSFSTGIKGRIPADNYSVSNAFSPGQEYNQTLREWVQKEADPQLRDKKTIAEYCPASLFTGRCRLYVQALYGQYLYPRGVRKPAEPNVVLNDSYAPPSISVIPPAGGLVGVQTSTGVYFDPISCKHWLLNISSDNRKLTAYPLKADAVAERYRHLLGVKSDLADEDRYHLEVYILGSSFPVASEVQEVNITGDIPETYWSMGYSWHWNYSGTCADLVQNTTYAQDNEELPDQPGSSSGVGKYRGMESTHFRLSATLTIEETADGPKQVWAAASSIISGPNKWSAPAGVIILTQILWMGGGLSKVIPRWTIPKNSNATFYAFYVGDTLKLCTVSNSVIPPKALEIEYSDETYYAYGSGNAVTVGMRGGWMKTNGAVATTYKGTMTCGGVSATFDVFGKTYSESEVDNKQMTGYDHSDIPFGQGSGITGDWSASVGYPPYETINFPYPSDPGFAAEAVDLPGTVTYDHTTSLVSESQGSYCIFVPARNDAEAVYLLARTHNIKYKTGRVTTNWQADGGITATQYRSTNGNSGPLIRYEYCSIGSSTLLTTGPREDTTEDIVVSEGYNLVCSAGTFGVSTHPFHPVTPDLLTFESMSWADFETRTSVGGAVLGNPDMIAPHGVAITTGPRQTAFIGWA